MPGQQVTVDLTNLPADYDVALYGDISAAFDQLSSGTDLSQLAAASAQGAPGSESQIPSYPAAATDIPTANTAAKFAPRIYAPDLYAPRIYAPRIYAPRIYAPRIYAPRIYAPDAYDPNLASDPDFSNAFSAAQDQTLLAVSSNTGTQAETRLGAHRQHAGLLLRPRAGPHGPDTGRRLPPRPDHHRHRAAPSARA